MLCFHNGQFMMLKYFYAVLSSVKESFALTFYEAWHTSCSFKALDTAGRKHKKK